MPLTSELPRKELLQEDAAPEILREELITGVAQYALTIADVAREHGFEAEWDRKEGMFQAVVFGATEDEFEQLLVKAQNRIAP